MNRFYAVTDRIAAFSLMAFLAIPDLLATTKVLATQPWESSADVPRPWAAAPASGNSKSVSMNASAAPAAATLTFDEAHSAFLNSHPSDALNKPNDDVYRFDLSSDPTQNVAVRFSAQGGTLGITVNGEHYLPVAGQEVVIAKELLREGTNTLLFSATSSLPTSVNRVEVRPSNKAASRELVLSSASSADFSVLEVNAGLAFALDRGQTAAIPVSLTNVTRGATAYRSLDRKEFVRVRIGVNRTLGVSKLREARVMYFDYPSRSWKEARVHAVDHAAFSLEAEVPGGTDYFAALIKSPEMPEAAAFMPTAISDLEPKSPAEGITLIQPPTANQQGDANISYPLSIPAGRQGMTPQLALNYSSSGGESWCGYGWSIPVQSISVDTRWGVPTFDDTLQSEVYVLNGESLHGTDGEKANRPKVDGNTVNYAPRRSGIQQFFTKMQSAYVKIERTGSGPNNYVWVVTDADQNKQYYGTLDGSNVHSGSCLSSSTGNIAQWYLTKSIDKWGNTILYTYSKPQGPTTGPTQGGQSIYLSTINYTGHNQDPGKYSVHFETATASRVDTRYNLNFGFKVLDNRSLSRIVVKYNGNEVKSFKLHQSQAAFFKTKLDSISEMRGNEVFYTHKMEYFPEPVEKYSAGSKVSLSKYNVNFGTANNILQENIGSSLVRGVLPSPIFTTASTGLSVGGTIGVGLSPAPLPKDYFDRASTISGTIGYSESNSLELSQFIDVNGDGIVDYLFYTVLGKAKYRPGKIIDGQIAFDQAPLDVNLDGIFPSTINSALNFGLDFVGSRNKTTDKEKKYVGVQLSSSNSETESQFLDFNSDGIIDITEIIGNQSIISFGAKDELGNITFKPSSAETLNKVVKDKSVSNPSSGSTTKEVQIVRFWEAPVSGTVSITGMAYVDSINGAPLNGVMALAIQKNGTIIPISGSNWTSVQAGAAKSIAIPSLVVTKGDLIMFRVNPEQDGQEDFLSWNPQIQYTGAVTLVDGSGNDYGNSNYDNAFLIEGSAAISLNPTDTIKVILNRNVPTIGVPLHYTIRIEEYNVDGDLISTKDYKNSIINGQNTNVFTYNGITAQFIGAFSPLSSSNGAKSVTMSFLINASSNIHWPSATWRPVVEVKSGCNAPNVFYPNVNYSIFNKLQKNDGVTLLPALSSSINYELFPEFTSNNWPSLNSNHIVYLVVKRNNATVAQKALEFNGSGFTTKEILGDGKLSTTISNVNFNGSAASFAGGGTNNYSFEFNIEDGPESELLANWLTQNLTALKIKSSTSTVSTFTGGNMKYHVYYSKWDEATRPFLHWGQFGWSPIDGNEYASIPISALKSKVHDFDNVDYSTAGPDSASFVNTGQSNNPSTWEFFTLSATRGESCQGCRSYTKTILNTEELRDRWSYFGSHIAAYKNSHVAPGFFGERERTNSNKTIVLNPYSAYGVSNVTVSNSISTQFSAIESRVGITASLPSKVAFFTSTKSSLMDLNGDQYPDIITSTSTVDAQLTSPSGGHKAVNNFSSSGRLFKSLDASASININGYFTNEKPKWLKKVALINPPTIASNWTVESLVDLNGDGLVDRIDKDNSGLNFELNNGSGFDAAITLPQPIGFSDNFIQNENTTLSINKSFGPNELTDLKSYVINKDKDTVRIARSAEIGMGVNASFTRNQRINIDLNGDGLTDVIDVTYDSNDDPQSTYVLMNTGTSFAPAQSSLGSVSIKGGQSTTLGMSINATGTYSWYFPLPSTKLLKLSGSLRLGASYSISQIKNSLRDMNGDGLVDYVVNSGYNEIEVFYNQTGLTNKLKKVINPLGGSFELEYERIGNKSGLFAPTISTTDSLQNMVWDMPSSKLVLQKLKINDGVNLAVGTSDLDGDDSQVRYFKYDGGIHSRREREFLGFTRVQTIEENQNPNGVASYPKRFLSTVVEYLRPKSANAQELLALNAKKGLIAAEYSLFHRVERVKNQKLVGNELVDYYVEVPYDTLLGVSYNKYEFRVVETKGTSTSRGRVISTNNVWQQLDFKKDIDATTVFPAIIETKSMTWPIKQNRSNYHEQTFQLDYDQYFNLTRYQDLGTSSPASPTLVALDTLVTQVYLYKYQVNECEDEGVTVVTLNNQSSILVVPCKEDPSYSTDTIWLATGANDCIGDPYGVTYCDGPILSTHRKLENVVSYVWGYQTNTTYSGERIAIMEYYDPVNAAGRTAQLLKHSVYLGSTTPANLKRQTEVTGLYLGNSISKFKTKLDASSWAEQELTYDSKGNVVQLIGPANLNGQRAQYNYSYDLDNHQFVTAVSNHFNESSCYTYDLSRGLLLRTVDINGHATQLEYDQFGRIKNVWAPKELRSSQSGPTISYTYLLKDRIAITNHNVGNLGNYNVALTQDPLQCQIASLGSRDSITNGVRTATFVDGLGKAIQVKTQKSLAIGAVNSKATVVSGINKTDKFGQVVLTRSDFIDNSTPFRALSVSASPELQKDFVYDYQHRLVSSLNWTPSTSSASILGVWVPTSTTFSWSNGLFGTTQEILSSAGNGSTPNSKTAEFIDSYGRKTKSIQYLGTTALTTMFTYNGLNELLEVNNPKGLSTYYSYDLAGRQLEEVHPDRGTTTMEYDPSGNVIEVHNEATNQTGVGGISMNYHFGRLISKSMPSVPGADIYNVAFTYGFKNDGNNGAGRITRVAQGIDFKDDWLKYDELGNVYQEKKDIDVPNVGLRSYTTKFHYDSFGRILRTIYPDNDQVDYQYTNLGELYSITSSVPAIGTQSIISKVLYDGYGNIASITHGNSAVTNYSYTPRTRSLSSSIVTGKNSNGVTSTLIQREYLYNNKGMISNMNRTFDASMMLGGESTQAFNYSYDALNRLSSANSTIIGSPAYSNSLSYDPVGGILSKQSSVLGSQTFAPNAGEMTYNLDYTYKPNTHQLATVSDAVSGDEMVYTYNTSGSISQIATTISNGKTEYSVEENFLWNFEQWLIAVQNPQGIHVYIFDHNGERIMKSSLTTTQVQINDEVVQDLAFYDPFTVYVNPYYVITSFTNGDKVSKHYYMGTQRVATDLGVTYSSQSSSSESTASNSSENTMTSSRTSEGSGSIENTLAINIMNIIGRPTSDTLKSLHFNTMTLEQAYPDGGGAIGEEMPQIGEDPGGYPSQARILYWYHPDYIQNVDLVTDLDGEAYELFLYNPWGEQLHHWSSNSSSWTSPYRFNAKEVDPETGLAYYGARYYKPTTSIWFSVDPKAHWYPPFSQYNFTLNNPINLLDPNGQWIEGAGFFRNLFNSDQKIRAHDEAAKHADGEAFEVKGGWRATWSSQNNDGGNDDVNLNNLHISDFTKGGRDGGGHNSIMDLWNSKANNKLVSGALNAVRGVFNSIVLTGGAVLTPITEAIHNGIYSDDIDRWSAQPWYLSKEFDLVRLPEGKEGYGEVMKSTIGAISLGIPSPKGLTVGDKGIIILGKSTVKSGLETGVDKATEE